MKFALFFSLIGATSIIAQSHLTLNDTHSLSNSVQIAWVSHYASGLRIGEDRSTDMVVGEDGNIYVTGYSDNQHFGRDYLTIKYDPSGNQIWTSIYSGDGDEIPSSITIDMYRNVYVTGASTIPQKGGGIRRNYISVKYDSSGIEQWVAQYDGLNNGIINEATAIGVDNSGNVFVTGRSSGARGHMDYATVKYNSFGIEQWVARYDIIGDDEATSLVVEDSGNVYVTGRSFSNVSGEFMDYATIKYNSSGVEQWVARYNNGVDEAAALVVDEAGNVYVTGKSSQGRNNDYATIKYNSSGVEQWATRYNGPGTSVDDEATALAVDSFGNVYVTGKSNRPTGNRDYDYATIKYDVFGIVQWVTRYDRSRLNDEATALALDGFGNVYVTGISGGVLNTMTVKYDAFGIEQWAAEGYGIGLSRDAPPKIAADNLGNIYVSGSTDGSTTQDYFTVKYNPLGSEQWLAYYDGPGNSDDQAVALEVDIFGNVYVAGNSHGLASDDDYLIVKYDASGIEQWVERKELQNDQIGFPKAIAADRLGNLYVIASRTGASRSLEYVTTKYSSSGSELWIARHNIPNKGSDDGVTALAVDGLANVYVVGNIGSGQLKDCYIIRYNSSGVEQWSARYNGPANRYDKPADVAVDNSGNVYVTGSSIGIGTSFDYFTIKYDSSGIEQWVVRNNGLGNGDDEAISIAVGGLGNIYVTGRSLGSGTGMDYATFKYSSSGVPEWVARYNGLGNDDDEAVGIAVDGAENVYITGRSNVPGRFSHSDYATIKYNSSGVEQWAIRYEGTIDYSEDRPVDIALDYLGNVYITGRSSGIGGYMGFATIKYNSLGGEQWVARYDGPTNSDAIPVGLALDEAGYVYVAGTNVGNKWAVFSTIKYGRLLVSVEEDDRNDLYAYSLMQNYPNPFNPSTQIHFHLPRAATVHLTVYNTLGKLVAELLKNANFTVGTHAISWNARNTHGRRVSSGLYIYRLEAGNFVATKKMLLLH